jgi:TolB-like protein/predicted Ser/Thr protein kinase
VGLSALTGQTNGHYHVLDELGHGGMGVVYKARDTRLGRLAALKVLRPDSAGGADATHRFLREAQTASALNHPHILTIYEIGTDAGLDYIAMEFVEGGTLADLIASGPLPAERALRLASQVADALAVAHAASVVHRDLKPSNIMMPAADRVKVVDFGLAKLTGPAASTSETATPLTAVGAIVGTAPYMSPEQASGLAVDARSDLFSLGSILYEMLAGRMPFSGDSAVGTLAAILKDTPAPIPGIRPAVARLVDRSLRKDPADRFQSAAELRSAIEDCLAPQRAADSPSIAVLPFTNMSGVKEDDYLCEGLAEEIIDALTRIPGLRVIARTSAFAIGRMGLDVREAGARLDVGTILEGSVRRAGARVRVTAQLVSTSDGSHVWSERYDRELIDVLVLEDEIAQAIAARLRVELAGGGRTQPPAVASAEAYTAYLEGRYYFARGTPDALAQAMACYERATSLDPGFALAYDSLAELYWYLGFFGNVPPREAFAVSTFHALRALELDDGLAQTHALLGMLRKELDYNWPEVDRELRRARQLNPESPLVRLRYAISGLLPHGRVEEGLAEIEAMLRTDPLSLFVRWWGGIMAYLARRPEAMIAEGRHMIALDPHHFLGHWTLGNGMSEIGGWDDAVASMERSDALSGGAPFTTGFLAYVYGRAGRREDTLRLLDRLAQMASAGYIPPSAFAMGHVGLEDWDAALSWLDKAIDARDPIVMPIKTFPFLDPIRGDARFQALLKKMRLECPTPSASA